MSNNRQNNQLIKRLRGIGWIASIAAVLAIMLLLVSSCSPKQIEKKVTAPKIKIRRVRQVAFSSGTEEPVNILLLGSDSRTESTEGRSDSLMLIHLDPKAGSASAISFPRDSRVTIPGHGTNKINAAMSYGGPTLTIKTIESLAGIKIDYYAVTTFLGFARMINNLGGVQITLDQPLKDKWAGANFGAGPQEFTGEEALAFCRSRHINNGDFTRAAHQQDLVLAIFEQERQKKEPQDVLKLLDVLMNDCDTNLSYPEMFGLAQIAIQIQPERINKQVLPGTTSTIGGASYVILDQTAMNKAFQATKAPQTTTDETQTTDER